MNDLGQVSKKCGSNKISDSKRIRIRKKLGPTILGLKKCKSQQKLSLKEILVWIFLCLKFFWVWKNLGPKAFGSEKNVGPKKYLCLKNLSFSKFSFKTNLGYNFFWFTEWSPCNLLLDHSVYEATDRIIWVTLSRYSHLKSIKLKIPGCSTFAMGRVGGWLGGWVGGWVTIPIIMPPCGPIFQLRLSS